ncbi:MAG: hypothetical protein DI586_05955 [Micavibrio aeruginosavorus]|uniref:histidine kinase n=1 Tax=Micavibrio aeruginosavorus TaxID=349221 RepID=A0A2W5HJ50_9BACT|nr:MAG: hypothetical protein DI586_05955 [Micavibrio aeruginosavorus]
MRLSAIKRKIFPQDTPQLKRDLLAQYVRNHSTSKIAVPASCVLLALMLSQWESWSHILPWLAISIFATICCHVVNDRYGDGSTIADDKLDSWAAIVAVPRMIFILCWASMAFWAWTPDHPETFFMIVALIMSTMAMNASQSGAYLSIYFMEMAPKLLALMVVGLSVGGVFFDGIVIIAFFGSLFFTKIAITVNRSQRMILTQKYELAKAKEDVEQASNAKSSFLATISHEVRTPLNGILGIINLVKYTKLTQEQDEYIETIRYSGETLLTMLNDILDFSKMEAGKVDVENVSFDTFRMVHSVTNLMWSRAAEKNVTIKYEVDDDVPAFVNSDPTRLRQILLNLSSNAIKFTEKGGVKIKVSLLEKQKDTVAVDDKVTLRFAVSDTGIGIPEEARQNMFGNFNQVDSSISRRFGGTGLGLSICKGLTELLGGKIDFSSELGKGSTFWIDIPVIVAASDATLTGAEQSQIIPVLEPIRILVAEDNRVNQKVIRGLLEHQGHIVQIVENGQEAFDAATSKEFDLILMDMQMPVVDGLEGTKRIIESGVTTPIIALTANEMDEDIRRCREVGMIDHIGKPIRPFALFSTLAVYFPVVEPKEKVVAFH